MSWACTRTVGTDLVNHCVNDIAVQGATPLFFLDYLASGQAGPEVTESVVTGLADGCKANGCALIGGETAQMPGFYADGEYDLAGFIVGAVDRDKMVTGAGIKPGDVLIGLPSTGLHTNGYSLARKLLFEVAGYKPTQYVTAIKEKAGAALMKTHRSYLHVIQKLVAAGLTTGMAHITGGGITENLPRILPKRYGSAGRDRVVAGAADLRASADLGPGVAGRDDAHVQHGHGADCGDSGGEIYAREESAGSGGREVLRDWAGGEGRAPGAVHMTTCVGADGACAP